MAVFLTIGFLELVTDPSSTPARFLALFLAQMSIGALVGIGAGRLGTLVLNRIHLDFEGLYPVLILAMVGATYSVTTLAGASGFLGIAAVLIFVARPVAVFLTLLPFRAPWRERTLIFDTVFFIVLTSVLVQGTTISFVARWLKVSAPLATRVPWPIQPRSIQPPAASLHELSVDPESSVGDTPIVELGLPPGTIIVLVERDSSFVVPTGSSTLRPGDRLLVLGDDSGIAALRTMLGPTDAE